MYAAVFLYQLEKENQVLCYFQCSASPDSSLHPMVPKQQPEIGDKSILGWGIDEYAMEVIFS